MLIQIYDSIVSVYIYDKELWNMELDHSWKTFSYNGVNIEIRVIFLNG